MSITSAIVLAGGRRRMNVRDRIKYFFYDVYYRGDAPLYSHAVYKPLDVKLVFNSKKGECELPLLLHKLMKLENISQLKEIVVVGKKKEMMDKNGEGKKILSFLKSAKKNYVFVDQNEALSQEVKRRLHVRLVSKKTLAYNGLLAYSKSAAYLKKKAALFTTIDDVLTTTEEYLLMLKQHKKDAAFVYPWVKESLLRKYHWKHRYYLKLYEQKKGPSLALFKRILFWLIKKKRNDHRIGRRVASMVLVNPFLMKHFSVVNTTYYARKVRDIPNLIWYFGRYALFFLWKYCILFNLTMEDISTKASQLLKGKVYSYDLPLPLSTLDIDTDKDASACIRTYNELKALRAHSFIYKNMRLKCIRYYDKRGTCFKEIF